jgi:hypothetical protein
MTKKNRASPNLPRIHLKTGERNGQVVVLCNLPSDAIWKVTEVDSEISCKFCLAKNLRKKASET